MTQLVSVQQLARVIDSAQGRSLVREMRHVEKGLAVSRGAVERLPAHFGFNFAAEHALGATRILARAESATTGKTARSFNELVENGTEFATMLERLGAGSKSVRVQNRDGVMTWMHTMRDLTSELVQPRSVDSRPLLDQVASADVARLRAIAGIW
jgi:hypothetical protein